MASPDPTRVGGLVWTQRTKGRLTPVERRKLLGHVAAGLGVYAAGRLRAATGRPTPNWCARPKPRAASNPGR
ncbi:MAG: hypothetical protein QOD39_5192 [Mycobacterium sp.]|nr:hypothetical protein [Mycobacterium sp.]